MMEKNTVSEETKKEHVNEQKTNNNNEQNNSMPNNDTTSNNIENTKTSSENSDQTNTNAAESSPSSPNDDVVKKIKEMEQQLSELNEKHLRLLAEFDNFRKRTRKEKEDLLKYAGENAWKSILPIIDDFERAIKENNNTNDIETVKKGFELIYNKIKHIIQQNNITAIDSLHKDFNPDIMEAMAKVPAPSEELKGKVVEEMEKAYQMNDKIIRFAKVIVAE